MALGEARHSNRSTWLLFLMWLLITIHGLWHRPFLLGWDSFGYHLYLPAAFIHHDPLVTDLEWVERIRSDYNASPGLYQLATMPDGARVIRYPIGFAIAELPWFLVGHVSALLTGYEKDGFSAPYQVSLQVGMMLYLLWGVLLLRGVLRRYFPEWASTVAIILLFLGTNLLDQSLRGQSMPHLPLFTMYALVLFLTVRWRSTQRMKDALLLGTAIGLGALIRPTEIIAILLPLLWPTHKRLTWKEGMIIYRWQWAAMAGVLFLMGMIQFTYWKLTTGSWLIDSYSNPAEGLDLLSPHTIPFLFSFRKGWYLYTPLMLLCSVALVLLWRGRHEYARPVTVFFFVNLYLVSSWTCWWYAESFGSRPIVSSYAIMALPLASLLVALGRWSVLVKALVWALLLGAVGLNLFQQWQFGKGLIHPSRMTKEAYVKVWGKTTPLPEWEDLLLIDRSATREELFKRHDYVPARYMGMVEAPFLIAQPGVPLDSGMVQGLRWEFVDASDQFTDAWRSKKEDITTKDDAFVEFRWFVRPLGDHRGRLMVVTLEHGGSYGYQADDILDLGAVPGAWSMVRQWYLMPLVRDEQDDLATYCWSYSGGGMEVIGPLIVVHERIDH